MIGSVIVGYLMFAEVPDLYTWLGTRADHRRRPAGRMAGRASAALRSFEEDGMPYLVAADLPTVPAGERFRALLGPARHPAMPGAHNGLAALQARAAGFDALYLSGAAMSASMGLPDLGVITVDEVCFFIRQVARARGPAAAGRRRHRLRRGAERHAHGARLRGGGRRRGPYRGPDPAQEVRPSERQEARRPARHGGQGRRRRQGTPRISSSSPAPMRRRAKASTAPWPAPGATSRPAPTRSSPRR